MGAPGQTIRVLFVCYANVCRSPLAAGLLHELARQRSQGSPELAARLEIASAGTSAMDGAAPHPLSCAIAEQHGFTLVGVSRQLVRDDLARFDHVIVMDRQNLAFIERFAGPRPNVRLLRAIAPRRSKLKGRELDVPDPIGGDVQRYAKVYELLREGCDALLDELVKT